MENNIQYHPAARPEKTAVTLMVHGLNVRPAAMLPLVRWLTGLGSVVYLIQLSGHHESSVPITDITSALWKNEMLSGYKMAREASIRHSLPLYFLGYSLGALLGQSLVVEEDVRFDRQILIAPATAIRWRSHAIRFIFFLGNQKRVPSYTPKEYRVNKALPLGIYRILFMEEKKVTAAESDKLNIPTLIVMDPKDELISYRKLVRLTYRFTDYQILLLDNDLKGRTSHYHHLVIDEQTMGKKNWERATRQMGTHFFRSG